METGDVKISLKNLDGKNIGEYLITNGVNHTIYSPYQPEGVSINGGLLRAVLRDHADMTLADLAVVLMSPCDR